MNSSALANIGAVARREFVVRALTRTYLVSTLVLVVAAVGIALVPVLVNYFNRQPGAVAVYVGASDLRADPIATLDALLNPPARDGTATRDDQRAFVVSRSTGLDADRARVLDGRLTALLDVERDSGGELTFTVYTKQPGASQTAVVSRQAATSIALADRLGRAGVTPAEQAALFAAPPVAIRSPDPAARATTEPTAQQASDAIVNLGLQSFLLLAIILYGNWIAQSVVEEKSSRMVEIMLAAATPFQLLAGKIAGVSAAALVQFVAVVGAAIAALVAEGWVAGRLLGESTTVALPAGLTPQIVVAFAILFVLGFVLYAALFAAAGSLVSRQEDVNQIVMPMTLAACGGYMIALYSALGVLDAHAPWIEALSFVPFLSPYMIVSRVAVGVAGFPEVALAVLLLAVTIVLAAWLAARVYAAGILMYGQRPGVRAMWAAMRSGG